MARCTKAEYARRVEQIVEVLRNTQGTIRVLREFADSLDSQKGGRKTKKE